MVRWTGATVLGAAVNLPHTADTDGLADVDVARDSSGADVEPGIALVEAPDLHD